MKKGTLFFLSISCLCLLAFASCSLLSSAGSPAAAPPGQAPLPEGTPGPSRAPPSTPPSTPPLASPTPAREYIDYLSEVGPFELPVSGASGYAAVELNIREGPSADTQAIGLLDAGEVFQVVSEEGDWWQVCCCGLNGWVMHKYCFINLPDIIPSIVYRNDNASASLFTSSGKDIPDITGEKLYEAFGYNQRLGREEYILPVLYAMAGKLCAAQQAALANGHTLILYEGFRPYDTQQKIVGSLLGLASVDEQVRGGISTPPWSIEWFIASGVSNHQMGYAVDVGLGEAEGIEMGVSGGYVYTRVAGYTPCTMPTPMHELSAASASLSYPVPSNWKDASVSGTMSDAALQLRTYCTEAGLTPLASEWWHFNDLDTAQVVGQAQGAGDLPCRAHLPWNKALPGAWA